MGARDDFKRSKTTLLIDPKRLKIEPGFNIRDMNSAAFKEGIERLADSIESQGFLDSHPIEYQQKGEEYFVRAGHRRLLASLLVIERGNVELFAVPCIPEAKGTKPADRDINLINSNSGERLTLSEEGEGFKRLMGHGLTIPDIARRCGRSVTHVNNALEFLAGPAEVHALVSAGKVSATTAAKAVREQGGEKATATLKEAADHAKAAGRDKVRPRDVEAIQRKVEPKTAPLPFDASPNAGKLAFDLVRKLAKRPDPLAGDFDEELRAFAKLVEEARNIAKGL